MPDLHLPLPQVCCFPELLTAYDWGAFTTIFTADEKVRSHGWRRTVLASCTSSEHRTLSPRPQSHIILLAAEAKKQAALLHGLSAVMKHVTAGPL